MQKFYNLVTFIFLICQLIGDMYYNLFLILRKICSYIYISRYTQCRMSMNSVKLKLIFFSQKCVLYRVYFYNNLLSQFSITLFLSDISFPFFIILTFYNLVLIYIFCKHYETRIFKSILNIFVFKRVVHLHLLNCRHILFLSLYISIIFLVDFSLQYFFLH